MDKYSFEEFLQDNDLNAFVKALEYAVLAKTNRI